MIGRRIFLWSSLLLSAPAHAQNVAVLEDSSGSIHQSIALPTGYLAGAACLFYQAHPDHFDAVFVFTTAQLNTLTRVQQGFPVKTAAQGIGRDNGFDFSNRFCTTRLRQAVKMGDIDAFDDDPDARYTGIPFFALTGAELMAHEFGHQWLASVRFQQNTTTHCALRGFEPTGEAMTGDCNGYQEDHFNQHWSYYLNSGSVMYGSTITDLGGGQFSVTLGTPKYSPLDQYLMGLRDPVDVPPMFYVDVGDVAGAGSASLPIQRGRTDMINGTRVDFTVQDVIAAEGARVPAREACHWKAAFILLHPAGQPPTASQLARVERYRQRWEEFYAFATDRRGSMDTTLNGSGTGTVECPGAPSPPFDGGVTPPIDAGMRDSGLSMDAVVFDASNALDATAPPDAGEPGVDAAMNVRDASLVSPPADAGAPGARTIGTADCECRATERGRAGIEALWVLLALLSARSQLIRRLLRNF